MKRYVLIDFKRRAESLMLIENLIQKLNSIEDSNPPEFWNTYIQLWRPRLSLMMNYSFNLEILNELDSITFEEALFIMLGINPKVLLQDGLNNWSIRNPSYKKEKGFAPVVEDSIKDFEIYKVLDRKFHQDKITTQEFINWSEANNHIKEDKALVRDLNNSPHGEEFAMKLYLALSSEDLISGRFEQLWEWNAPWNLLNELVTRLHQDGHTKTRTKYSDIQSYINYSGKTELRKQYQDDYKPGEKSTSPLDNKLDRVIGKL